MTHDHDDLSFDTLREAAMVLMTAAELRRLAALTGARLPTRKAELVEVIVRHLEGDGLLAAWRALDETQQLAVAEVVHSGGSVFHEDRFEAKYGAYPTWGSLDPYGRGPAPTHLCFFLYDQRVLPDDLKARLLDIVPAPDQAVLETVEEVPETWSPDGDEPAPVVVHQSERAARLELLRVLRLVDAGKVSVGPKTRKPTRRALDVIAAALEGGDFYPPVKGRGRASDAAGPIRAFAWPLLLQAGKLVGTTGSRLELTKAGRAALSAPPEDTLKRLWKRWLGTTLLDELSRIDAVKGQGGKGKRGLVAVRTRRAAIAEALAGVPRLRWFSPEAFRRYLRATGSGYFVAHHAWDLYVCEPRYGSLGYDGRDQLLDDRYLWCFLFEYAATLGLLDVACVPPAGARDDYFECWGTDGLPYFSRYDGLLHMRLTAMGAYCLELDSSYTAAPMECAGVFRVLPNFEVVAMVDRLEPADRLALDAYAVPVSERVWRLEAACLLAALEAGHTMLEVRQFLGARSATPLPATVLRLLDDIEARATCIRASTPARLVECRDPDMAALVANHSRTRPHCLLAGERHLAIPAESEAAFRRALREVGYVLT